MAIKRVRPSTSKSKLEKYERMVAEFVKREDIEDEDSDLLRKK